MQNLYLSLTLALGAMLSGPALAQSGTLVFGRSGDSVGLDPAAGSEGESFNVTAHIFETLVALKNGTTDLVPALARTWDVSKDGKTYTFHLAPGVQFSDATPLDAAAVVYSFKRQYDKTHPAYGWGGPYAYFEATGMDKLLKDVTARDPQTVVFQLTRPNAPFISMLSMAAFGIVSPTALAKSHKDFAQHPVGSGPYVLRVWEKKQKIVLEANPTYWGTKPKLKTLIFRAIPDNGTRLQEMLAGNLHVMDNPDTNHIETMKKQMGDKVKMLKGPGFNVGYLAINFDKKPFDNVLVRRAVAHAINKKAIVANIYNGYGIVAKNPMPPSLWGYNDQISDYAYDPTKAKELLAKAGLAQGFTTDLWAMPVARPYMPDGRKVAEAIQGDLAKVGITAHIVSYDWGTYLDKTSAGEHALALMGWTGDIGDPDNFLYVLLDKDNAVKPAQNLSFYKSESLHVLLAQAQVESDRTKRTALYRKAQVIIHDDCPLVEIAHSEDVIPVSSRVSGMVVDPTGRRLFTQVELGK